MTGISLNLSFFLLFAFALQTLPQQPEVKKKQKNPIDIGFVKDKIDMDSGSQATINIPLKVNQRVYYKLLRKDKIVAGSILNEGLNFLSLPARDILVKNGLHQYVLVLKKGSSIQKRIIEFQVKEETSGKKDKLPGKKGDLVFVNKKFSSSIKKLLSPPAPNPELAEKPVYSPFFNPYVRTPEGASPAPPQGVGILGAAYLIYQTIKGIIKKKKKEKEKKKRVFKIVTFSAYRKNGNGDEIPLEVSIKLKVYQNRKGSAGT